MIHSPFWKNKTLSSMNRKEWESLCDGCGLCCLYKVRTWDTGRLIQTSVACELFDPQACQCKDYPNRAQVMNHCIVMHSRDVPSMDFLPETCAYRLVDQGRDLYWWHHLISGDRETVHQAGISARGKVRAFANEIEKPEDYARYFMLD